MLFAYDRYYILEGYLAIQKIFAAPNNKNQVQATAITKRRIKCKIVRIETPTTIIYRRHPFPCQSMPIHFRTFYAVTLCDTIIEPNRIFFLLSFLYGRILWYRKLPMLYHSWLYQYEINTMPMVACPHKLVIDGEPNRSAK